VENLFVFLSSRLSVENRQTTVAFPQKSLIRTMADEKFLFWKRVGIVSLLLMMLWAIHFLQYFHLANFDQLGNMPGKVEGLPGILFSPFLHGSLEHLVSNTLPMLVLLTVLLNAYPRHALIVLVFVHLVSNTMVWALAPENTVHIGISGIIYGIASFLLASGVFRRDRTAMAISFFVALLYGGMVAGFIPQQGVSWQSHLFGAISGVVIAFFLRRLDLPPPHEFDLEEREEERHFFDR